MTRTKKQSTEAAVREIRRRTRRKFAPEVTARVLHRRLVSLGSRSLIEPPRHRSIRPGSPP